MTGVLIRREEADTEGEPHVLTSDVAQAKE